MSFTAYNWRKVYHCERCGVEVSAWAVRRWCEKCRKIEYPKSQREARRRYVLKMRRKAA